MIETPFIADIRGQGEALRRALDGDVLRQIAEIRAADYHRVVLSGMGASLFALYPAWLSLVQAGVPAWWVDASELLHDAEGLITERTLVLLTSQSGRSAEIVALLEALAARRPRCMIGITNDPESPLGRGADRTVPLLSGQEHTVSTKSYMNTLAVAHLVAGTLLGTRLETGPSRHAADALDRYLGTEWERHGGMIDAALDGTERLVILGRGAALATAWQGALVLKEAAKVAAEGLGAAQFRHGPLELADERLTAIILEGDAETATLNRRLASDLVDAGAQVLWVGRTPPLGVPALPTPEGAGVAREVVDIVVLDIASVALARAGGFVPGEFRHGGKVTTTL